MGSFDVRWLWPLLVAGACDDTVFVPCGELTPDWAGVQCTLNTHCISCHSNTHDNPPVQFTVLPHDLQADLYAETGELVVPGDPAASALWRAVSGDLDPELDIWGIMPWGAEQPLPESEIGHIRTWIEDGAPLEGR